jgi:hypothetical protein
MLKTELVDRHLQGRGKIGIQATHERIVRRNNCSIEGDFSLRRVFLQGQTTVTVRGWQHLVETAYYDTHA